jgi:hypothetical protein
LLLLAELLAELLFLLLAGLRLWALGRAIVLLLAGLLSLLLTWLMLLQQLLLLAELLLLLMAELLLLLLAKMLLLLLSLLLLPLLLPSSPPSHPSCIFAVLASERWRGAGGCTERTNKACCRRSRCAHHLPPFKNQFGPGEFLST